MEEDEVQFVREVVKKVEMQFVEEVVKEEEVGSEEAETRRRLAEGGVGMRRVDPGREAAAQLRQVAWVLGEAAGVVEGGAMQEGRATLEDIGEVAARAGETLDEIMKKGVE